MPFGGLLTGGIAAAATLGSAGIGAATQSQPQNPGKRFHAGLLQDLLLGEGLRGLNAWAPGGQDPVVQAMLGSTDKPAGEHRTFGETLNRVYGGQAMLPDPNATEQQGAQAISHSFAQPQNNFGYGYGTYGQQPYRGMSGMYGYQGPIQMNYNAGMFGQGGMPISPNMGIGMGMDTAQKAYNFLSPPKKAGFGNGGGNLGSWTGGSNQLPSMGGV